MDELFDFFKGLDYLLLGYVALCGLVYRLFDELQDHSMHSKWKRFTNFLNSDESSDNKWKPDSNGELILVIKDKIFRIRLFGIAKKYCKWYYFGIDPKYKERFWLSSTVLVFVTDGEHLFQWLKNRMIEIGLYIIFWQFAVIWFISTNLMSYIKEKFLKKLQ